MSAIRWTDAQRRALDTRGSHVLVSAAAGSGKTAVLVERIVRRITVEGGDIDRLLVVTFTDAAAAQMRDRLTQTIEARLEAAPGDAHLARQLMLLPRASIATLHSFCLNVVRQHFYTLGLDPNVRIMDEQEAYLLRLEVLDAVLEAAYDGMDVDEPFARLVEAYGGQGGDTTLQQLMLTLHDYARSLPDPHGWLRECGRAYGELDEATFDDTPWAAELQQEVSVTVGRALRFLQRALDVALGPGGAAAHAQTIEEDMERLEKLRQAAAHSWTSVVSVADAAQFPRMKSASKGEADPDVRKATTALRDKAKEAVHRMYDKLLARPLGEQLAALRDLGPVLEALTTQVIRLDQDYAAAKSARGLIDFADIEHLCLELLRDPEVAGEVQDRFDEVLVDECQDLNGVQDEILKRVSRAPDAGGELFLVGDVKQSIYRFRQADPGLFLGRYQRASTKSDAAEQRIDLRENFRSRRTIVDAVNFVFRQIMTPGAGEMAYSTEAELVFGASFGPAEPQIRGSQIGGAQIDDSQIGGSHVDVDIEPPIELHLLERDAAEWATADEEMSGISRLSDADAREERRAAAVALGTAAGEAAAAVEQVAAPEQAVTAPEQAVTAPEQAVTAPEQAVTAPEQAVTAPEQAVTAPEQAVTAPEQAVPAAPPVAPKMSAFEREAAVVAGRIRQLVDGGEAMVWDGRNGCYRPARYRDIVILMRATRHRANELVDVLSRSDIPAYAELGTGYFAATEIETMMALLSILDNPRQDIELAAVLRSPVVGCSAEELARIRLSDRHGDFYDAVVATAGAEGAGELGRKLEAFLSFLDDARTMARRMPLSQLVWRLLKETGYYDYAGAMPGGRGRQANLRALHERARQFDSFARQGLARFLQFIQRLREADGDLGTAPTMGESDDVVRIMSVHTSKGLQFPIVFIMDCGRKFHGRPVHGDIAFQRHLGLGARLVDGARRFSQPSVLHAAVTARRRREELAEEMRLLYVAMTRAQERLIIVGSADKLSARAADWAAAAYRDEWPLDDAHLLSANGWLDWLGSALMRHADSQPLWAIAEVDQNRPVTPLSGDESRWDIRLLYGFEYDMDGPLGDGPNGHGPLGDGPNGSRVDVSWPAVAALQPREGRRVQGLGYGLVDERVHERTEADGERVRPDLQPVTDAVRLRAELKRRLSWRYPWEAVVGRPAKQGVSELKRRWDAVDADEKAPVVRPTFRLDERPAFLQATGRPLTATERGAAIHLVMQHLDLAASLDEADIVRQMDAMVEKQMLTPEQRDAVTVAPIARFFESSLGRRLRAGADEVQREVPFMMGLPAREAYRDLDDAVVEGEIVVVQGIIDCLLHDDAGLLVVDFKTDRVSPAGVHERAARYKRQVELYRRAVRDMYDVDAVETYLVFLEPGIAVSVD